MLGAVGLVSCQPSLTDVRSLRPPAPNDLLTPPADGSGIPPGEATSAIIFFVDTYAELRGTQYHRLSQPGLQAEMYYFGDQAENTVTFSASGKVSAGNTMAAQGLGTDYGGGARHYVFRTDVPLPYLPDCGETLSGNSLHHAWLQVRYPAPVTWGDARDASIADQTTNPACPIPTPPPKGGDDGTGTTGGTGTGGGGGGTGTAYPAPPPGTFDPPPPSGPSPGTCQTTYLFDGLGNMIEHTDCYT